MSISHLRTVVENRRTVGDRVAEALIPVEQSAHRTAIEAAGLVGVVLQAHTEASLPPSVGMETLQLLSEASHLAAQSRAKLGAAHAQLRALSQEHGVIYAGPPECPPNDKPSILNPFTGN